MNICLITGDHPRHKYILNKLVETGKLTSCIIQKRELMIPDAPQNIDKNLKEIFHHHFQERDRIEDKFFGNLKDQNFNLKSLELDKKNINSLKTIKFLNEIKPDLVISYGCTKISEKILSNSNADFWNIHGGLSPYYRGVITHFWPSYFLEPQMTGMTLHQTTNAIDGGNILMQTSSKLVRGDTLHALASRNVYDFGELLKEFICKIDLLNIPKGIEQKSSGKIFLSSDWRPEHLRLIYDVHNDRIVDKVLDGELVGKIPKLIS